MADRRSTRSGADDASPFAAYQFLAGIDEMFDLGHVVRPEYRHVAARLAGWDEAEARGRQGRADLALLNAGITFTVYADEQGVERIFPFSLIPRIIGAEEWRTVETGLQQRITCLNRFLADVYGDQRVVKDGVVPADLVFGSPGYNLRMVGVEPPLGVYIHVAGCDLVRDGGGRFVVLEDNVRTPSGVSYVIENRSVMLRVCPDLFPAGAVRPVNDYPAHLHSMLVEVRPEGVPADEVTAVVLTPGIYNSAYFEHAFLAQQMGIQLVEPFDLVVFDDRVYLRSTGGLKQVHVIYRRIDDEFLDPVVFREDSMLGVPGLMNAYASGGVTLVNAVGTGVADDKTIYRFVPDLIRYYLGEDPILANVETYVAALPADREKILANLRDLVVKPTNASGGYGIVIGPQASDDELRGVARAIEEDPRNWIAQPIVEFSTIPTLVDGILSARRADVRPFVLTGERSWVLPGGLTRVALVEGSYVVNSSQGGGSKDTWVLTNAEAANA